MIARAEAPRSGVRSVGQAGEPSEREVPRGKIVPGWWGSGRSVVSAKSKARRARGGAAPPYQLKIWLRDIRPEIWRRVLVPGNIHLGRLHGIIQVAMGWTNSHLHQFTVGDTVYTEPHPDFEGDRVENERKARLCDVAPRANGSLLYEYDFGDSWEHVVLVEKILKPGEGVADLPVCLGGARACPPEDCGGVPGYESFLEAIRDPDHEEHDAMLEWVGGHFDPEAFDLKRVNGLLQRMR